MKPIASPRLRMRLLTPAEVAADLKVSIKTIRRMIERRELRVHRVGRSIRISEDEVLLFLSRNQGLTTPDH